MFNRIFLFISLLFFTALSAHSRENIRCLVVGISDGDTLTCLTDNYQQIKVRLENIDAPEKGQAFGQKAKKALSDMVFKREVQLVISGQDRYHRTLAVVYYNNQNINLTMVKKGMAWAYKQYLRDPIYLTEQSRAQSRRIGLWADPNPMMPSDWRKAQKHKR